jgi:hypothetical protein
MLVLKGFSRRAKEGRIKAMRYPEHYVDFLVEFHASRDYFECHEILEELWKSDPASPYAPCWLALLRIAVALYHARRGNGAGAVKLMRKVVPAIEPERMDELGLDGTELVRQAGEWLAERVQGGGADYRDLDLPIADAELLEECLRRSRARGLEWGSDGRDAGEAVIHRHLLRDRTAVCEARRRSADAKARARKG